MLNDKDTNRCLKRLYSIKKSQAKSRNIEFSLPLDLFKTLSLDQCIYCGSMGSNLLKYLKMEFPYNGIDRIDTKGSYEPGNVVSACRFCNSLRGSMPFDLWAEFIDSVAEHSGGKRKFETKRNLYRQKASFYKR